MRIAIFGTGGAGGYFGARLARAGVDVAFLARGEHLRAILRHGLRVDTPGGSFTVRPARATDDPARVGHVDVILVGVKTWQVPEAASAMRPMIGPETFAVPLQNGVEAPAQLAAALGAKHATGGLCAMFSFVEGPGRIRCLGGTHFFRFGELDNRPSERTERLRQVFVRAGVAAEIPADIQAALWEKFLLIVPFGGLGAVTRAPVGVLRSLSDTREMLERGMHEIHAVARACRVFLPDDIVEKTMAFVDTLDPGGTTSLQRDVVSGKPSELEAWNGAVVRFGRKAGVATPLHAFIYQCLRPMELRARGQMRFPVS
jgi:2-dehydropantoate 2-reductase